VIALDDVLAHRPPLRLLDRIVEVSESAVLAETVVRSDNAFFEPGSGLPAYVGLEMMAQAIAAIDGFKCHQSGLPAKIGFLLGCRRYVPAKAMLQEGETLRISAQMVFQDHAMLAFDCRIDCDGEELATADLKVYAPADPVAFLRDQVTP
jgi:predicted hotdog family 3-hydroxylacyl-ACP dehydratase